MEKYTNWTEDFLKQKNNFEILFLTSLQIILGILWIAFFAYAFSPQFDIYVGPTLAWLPEHIGGLRGAGVFLIMWYLILQIIIFWLAPERKQSLMFYFNFTLLGALVSFGYLVATTRWSYFHKWIKNVFASDPDLAQTFHRRSWQYIMMVCLMVFMIQAIFVSLYVDENSIETALSFDPTNPVYVYMSRYPGLWFGALMFFTIQTNLLCFSFTLLFVINPTLKIFKHNSLLMYCVVYIVLVGVVYNTVIMPAKISNGSILEWSPYHWYANTIQHILDPLFFGAAGIVIITNKRSYHPTTISKHFAYGLLIPFVYLVFASFSSFLSGVSAYDQLTNLNRFVLSSANDIKSYGKEWYVVYLPLFFSVFALTLFGIYHLDKYCGKKYLATHRIVN